MSLRHTILPLLATSTLLLSAVDPARAEKPDWTPVAELLVLSIGQSDPFTMSEVMTRCSALSIILAGLASDETSDLSLRYQAEAETFIQNAVVIDSSIEEEMTGEAADIPSISDATMHKVDGMLDSYNEWLDDNMDNTDSPFSEGFDMEVESCQLASRFVRSQ